MLNNLGSELLTSYGESFFFPFLLRMCGPESRIV
jgi:hypothetical protein